MNYILCGLINGQSMKADIERWREGWRCGVPHGKIQIGCERA